MNEIQKYFKKRQSLIDQYLKGDMTKQEYLKANYDAVVSLNINPFQNMDTVEKGLFNYQYYNAMAKDAKITSYAYDDFNMQKEMRNESDYFYYKKDNATLKVLKLLDYQNITAYFVKIRSKYLRGKLFEILIEDYDMILHSANELILKKLREEGVFKEETKQSLIDHYINQKY